MLTSIQRNNTGLYCNQGTYVRRSKATGACINILGTESSPQVNTSSSKTVLSESDVYQLFQNQSTENTAVKNRMDSFVSLGDTWLTAQQMGDLKEKYDMEHLSDADVESLFDDLVELGAITETDRKFALNEELPATFGRCNAVYASWVPASMRKVWPNFLIESIIRGPASMKQLNQKINFCNENIAWLSDEANKGLNGYEEENCKALSLLKESSQKVMDVMNALKTN